MSSALRMEMVSCSVWVPLVASWVRGSALVGSRCLGWGPVGVWWCLFASVDAFE